MAFDFPASPAEGASYTPFAGGPTYIFNAPAWRLTAGSIPNSSNLICADAPPSGPNPGQLWWESDSGRLFTWFVDANTSQWVQISGPFQTEFIKSDAIGMRAGFKFATTNRFVVNDNADGSGTDRLYIEDDGTAVFQGTFTVRQYPATNYSMTLTPANVSTMNVGGAQLNLQINSVTRATFATTVGLDVVGGSGSSGHTILARAPAAATASHGVYGFGAGGGAGCFGIQSSIFAGLAFNVTSEGTWSVYGSNNAKLATGTWQTSDARIKTDQQDYSGEEAIAAVKAVPVITYRRLDEALRLKFSKMPTPLDHIGWRAQDIQPVIPQAVSEHKVLAEDFVMRAALRGLKEAPDIDSDEAKALGEGEVKILDMKDTPMIAVLWRAVQELIVKIEALEAA